MDIEPFTFQLEGFEDSVEVELTDNINKDQLLQFPAFRDWVLTLCTNLDLQRTNADHTFASDPYKLSKVKILSVYWFRPINKIGFVKLEASIYNSKGKLPGVAFLRGGSVAMLMILRPRDSRDERWVVMTEQPRIPAGSLRFVEIPAGMIDEATNDFAGKAAAEIFEETGFKLPKDELIDLTELALKASVGEGGEKLENAMYPSPGGSDEYIPIFLWEKELDRQEIEDLRGKLTGNKTQNELIKLRVCDYEELWKLCPRDGKTLAAWALYEGLNRAGLIQKELQDRKRKAEMM